MDNRVRDGVFERKQREPGNNEPSTLVCGELETQYLVKMKS